jgi:hypothetical protein
MAIAFAVILSFKKSLRQNNLSKDTSSEIGINLVEYSTNDIYLQTNKLIC